MAIRVRYSMRYRPIGSFFWRNLKNIREDGYVDNTNIRYFINDDDERIEISMNNIEIIFSSDRLRAIEEINKEKLEKIKQITPIQ